MGEGNIPVFMVEGKTLPEAWERAVLKTWEDGVSVKTEYDRPGDPPSKDCTMILVITHPLAEPRIHRAFPASLEELEIYRQEVIYGIHDHWINPAEGKWTYTYHKRLFSYEMEGVIIDQINYIIGQLTHRYYTRRAQAITWNVKSDPGTDDPPCLQRIWCRLLEKGETSGYVLNMNTHWRSRDIYKAAFMNDFALIDLQHNIAEEIADRINSPVSVGRFVDIIDSAHIYGAYYEEFKGFLETMKKRDYSERTWTSEFAEPFFAEARQKIASERECEKK